MENNDGKQSGVCITSSHTAAEISALQCGSAETRHVTVFLYFAKHHKLLVKCSIQDNTNNYSTTTNNNSNC